MPRLPIRSRAIPFVALVAPVAVIAQRPTAPTRASVIQRALQATVRIEAITGNDTATGSGVVISPLGIIATAAHVVDGSATIRVRGGGIQETVVTGVYTIDRRYDFALLRIAAIEAPTLRLGNLRRHVAADPGWVLKLSR